LWLQCKTHWNWDARFRVAGTVVFTVGHIQKNEGEGSPLYERALQQQPERRDRETCQSGFDPSVPLLDLTNQQVSGGETALGSEVIVERGKVAS
jgi:hypothetical protein